MRRGAWLGLFLAGCSGRAGLLVEVTAPAGTDKVELFLSTKSCGDQCPSITPPGNGNVAAMARTGTGWLVDDTVPYVVLEPQGGATRFLLESPTAADTDVQRILAVGLSQDVPTSVAVFGPVTVPHQDSVIAKVTLDPAKPLDTPSSENVLVWNRPVQTGKTACAIAQHGTEHKVEFFVPVDDTDCDDAPNMPECNPFAYRVASSPPTDNSKASCMTDNQAQSCVMGGVPCSELQTLPPSLMCVPMAEPATTYCLPQFFCGLACKQYDALCIRPALATTVQQMPSAACDVLIDTTGAPCAPATATLDVSGLVFDTQGKCKSIKVGRFASPPTFGDSALVEMAMINVSDFQSEPCSATLTISGMLDGARFAALEIVTDADVHRIVPLSLAVHTGTCDGGGSVTCDANQGDMTDPVYSCQ